LDIYSSRDDVINPGLLQGLLLLVWQTLEFCGCKFRFHIQSQE